MNRVLVTGGSGFIGRAVIPRLLDRGFEVHAVSRRESPPTKVGFRWHSADVLSEPQVEALLRHVRPSHLLHLAWITTPGTYVTSSENAEWCRASTSLVEHFAGAGGKRAVIAGTCFEYDLRAGLLQEDATPLHPTTPYGVAKHALHTALASLAQSTGLSLGWARLFYLYGPYERPERLVPYVVNQLLRGEPAEVTTGEQARDYLYVEDVAEGIARYVDSSLDHDLNIASGEPVAVRDIVKMIGDLVGKPDLIRWGARSAAASDPFMIVADITRVRRELEWEPAVDLGAGLEKTIRWWSERR